MSIDQFAAKYGTHGPKLLGSEILSMLTHGQESAPVKAFKEMMQELQDALLNHTSKR